MHLRFLLLHKADVIHNENSTIFAVYFIALEGETMPRLSLSLHLSCKKGGGWHDLSPFYR